MRATQVLQKCLSVCFVAMHAVRTRVLLRSVEALLAGRPLTLIDVACTKRAKNSTVGWRTGCCAVNDR